MFLRSSPSSVLSLSCLSGRKVLFQPKPSLLNRIYSRSLFVQTLETPNENSLKFLPMGEMVLGEGNSMEFNTFANAQKSPLVKELFKLEGVKSVFLGPDFISVMKEEKREWTILKMKIFSVITEFYDLGKAIVENEPEISSTTILPEDDEVVSLIKEILETRIRPGVQEDGGDIEYKGFVDGVVLLKMKGSCRGCSKSSITLKGGIERLLQHYVPEVIQVMAVEEDDMEKINLESFERLERQIEKQNSIGKTGSAQEDS